MKIKDTLQKIGMAIGFGCFFGFIAVKCVDIYFEDIAWECERQDWTSSDCQHFLQNLHPEDPILTKLYNHKAKDD